MRKLRNSMSRQRSPLHLSKRSFSINDQSSLFLRLPLEIRRMIYEETLGNGIYGITLLDGRITTWQDRPQPTICLLNGRPDFCYDDRSPLSSRHPSRGCLGLILSCRATHDEAISYLYNSSIFVFHDVAATSVFIESCPEKYRRLVPHIAVDPNITGSKVTQEAIWSVFCRSLLEGFTGITTISLSHCNLLSINYPKHPRTILPTVDLEEQLLTLCSERGERWRWDCSSINAKPNNVQIVGGKVLRRVSWQHYAYLGPEEIS